jgi:hypothetical protein
VGPRAGLEAAKKRKSFPFLESNPDHPARSPPLYRLSCHECCCSKINTILFSNVKLTLMTITVQKTQSLTNIIVSFLQPSTFS